MIVAAKRCDNCFFSTWMKSPGRAVLVCKQRPDLIGRWQVVILDQKCPNFYPSGLFTQGTTATRRIPLTQGKFAIVDEEDYYQLSQYQWFAAANNRTYYAVRKQGGRPVKMHRWVMGAPAGMVVDHIDHDGLNNCKNNLRLCTPTQNKRNAVSNRRASSKYKGVCRHRKIKKWGAAIKYNRKSYNLGYFTDEVAAAKAYDKKAAEFFGEFAYLNFPSEIKV
jgi:hypothetical protein